jgi:hypothetical protein
MSTPTGADAPSEAATAPGRAPAGPALTRRQKVGLWILIALGVLSALPFLQDPTSSGTTDDGTGEAGPPAAIIVLDGILVIGMIVAIVIVFRTRSRVALRAACGLAIVNAITALPAFFADQPAVIVVEAAVFVLATAAAVVLALRTPHATPELLPSA